MHYRGESLQIFIWARLMTSAGCFQPGSPIRMSAASTGDESRTPLLVPTSAGQLLDRISILKIKAEKTRGRRVHSTVLAELRELLKYWTHIPTSSELLRLEEALCRVNSELWEVEDQLRFHESRSDFGADFVTAARAVYRLNDDRFQLKRQVDLLLGSTLSETKVYPASDTTPDVGG